jgi:HSP20 family protein
MTFNHSNINQETLQETFSKFNDLGAHVVGSLFDIATPILSTVGGVNIQQHNQWLPFCDIKDTPTDIKILVSMPGVKKEDINVMLKHRTLEVAATTNISKDVWKHINDRTYKKTFKIPDNIENKDLKVHYENGILKILVYKTNTTSTEGEKIEIN